MTRYQRIVDAHCEDFGGVLPADPEALRSWLLALAQRAYDNGRRTYHTQKAKS